MRVPRSFALAVPSRRGGELELSKEYLADIHRVEALARNQSGADKEWVEKAVRDVAAHFAAAKRVG